MQQYGHLTSSMAAHGHQSMHQPDYISIPQMSQTYTGNSPNSYSSVPMTTVIQHRMPASHTSLTAQHPLSSPHQRLGPSPSSCAVSSANNFYIQGGNSAHPSSHTPVPMPTPTPTPSATPTLQMNSSSSTSVGPSGANSSALVGNMCSLSKLQQLTNGLEVQPCNTPPAGTVNLTPPPNHPHPHSTMTPPPTHLGNNRNLPTPPTSLQTQMGLQYHKYYSGNMNVTPPITSLSQNTGRSSRNTASAPVQHMSAASSRSPNVTTLSSNLMSAYQLNGYRVGVPAQQPTGYITNPAAAGFINNPAAQITQMGVMNMQSQYQDPTAIQRAAQQNSMYPSYSPYIPLNGSMRR